MINIKWTLGIIALVLLSLIIRDALRIKRLSDISNTVIKTSPRFDRTLPNAPMRVYIIGDSTAAGTGVTNANDSIAGRLGSLYPTASIENHGIVGQKIHELVDNLDLPKLSEKDILLIQIGGNDLIQFTNLDDVKKDLYVLLEKAKASGAGKVAILHTAKLGTAPLFPPYLGWIMTHKAQKMRTIYMEAASQYGIRYIDLINDEADAKFAADPEKFYSPDGIHPSGDGYAIWFESIKKDLEN